MTEVDWHSAVDGYCERLAAGFWAEPLNALSNLAFWLAALWLSRALLKRRGAADGGALFLVACLWTIGLGSFLFHTVATRWAALADVLPIALFILGYVFLGLRRFFGRPPWQAALGPPALLALAVGFGALGLGSASGYLPALVGLVGFSAAARGRLPRVARGLLSAAAVFALSLTLRSLDQPLCERFPGGTHWTWHLLNALTLWLVTRVYMEARYRPTAGAKGS